MHEVWTPILFGFAIGGFYLLVMVIVTLIANHREDRRFMKRANIELRQKAGLTATAEVDDK